jgi:hypothetical protein
MSDSNPVLGGRGRLRTILKWLGRGYLSYHLVAASLMTFAFLTETRSGYWRDFGVLSEFVLMIILYPLAIPALVMCGGPHNCGSRPAFVFSVPVLLLTLVAAASGIRLAVGFVQRLKSRPSQASTV